MVTPDSNTRPPVHGPLPTQVPPTWQRCLTLLALALILVAVPNPGFRHSLAAERPQTDRVDFNFHIRPILSDRCFTCHGPDERSRKAKLRLDTREGAMAPRKDGGSIVKPGDPEGSALFARLISKDPEELMPPPESKLQLSTEEIELIRRWIQQGAEWKPHWAFIPVQSPPLPTPSPATAGWPRNAIDPFILVGLERLKLSPAPEAARAQVLRRVTLDLTGLPPTPEEITSFLNDTRSDAYEIAVDRLLQSPAYGERMAAEWMDLARYADTYGYQSDVERDMSPWRDWVLRALNNNLPYNQFLLWQLAGDLLPNATREQRLATAFNRLHRQTNEGGSIEEEFRTEYVADRVHTVGTAVLGLTLECARCHDHKYDPISQKDYYGLFGFFNNIDESGLYSHFTAATPTPTLFLPTPDQEAALAKASKRIRDAGATLAMALLDATNRFRTEPAATRVTTTLQLPAPAAAFTFETIVSNTIPNLAGGPAAQISDAPELVTSPWGKAVQFDGDNQVICKGVGHFKRSDPFTIGFRTRIPDHPKRAVVLHHSRAWTDSGSRGYELVLEDGRPFFALIHFWPGNAIAIRGRHPLPTNQWVHLTLSYDGSSRAEGLRLHLNGRLLDTEIVRNNLYRDILHRGEWGDSDVGNIHLTLGGRFRDSGFKAGSIDDLQVFTNQLSQVEIRSLAALPHPDAPTPADLFEHFTLRSHPPSIAARAALEAARADENDAANRVRQIMTMQEMATRRPTHLLKRGSYETPGEPVAPHAPAAIPPALSSTNPAPDRLALAQWITDRKNPLTARVLVNRVWKLHFGRGLVTTVEDFGAQGQLPSHPELLDWLSAWLMDNGWNRKALHRLIVTSAAYRQSSVAPPQNLARDPDNRWISRGPKQRLSAEQIRDQALAASGLLTPRLGGPSVKPYQPPGVWEESGTGKVYTQDKGEKLYRRSLYTFWRRTAPPPSMLSFDATSREVCTAKRETTSTPLQALVLLNDPQLLEACRRLAENAAARHPGNPERQLAEAFLTLLGRQPDPGEQAILRRMQHSLQTHYASRRDDAAKIARIGESKPGNGLPQDELGILTLTISALMNHDEFVMNR